jgi:hypothetical protein
VIVLSCVCRHDASWCTQLGCTLSSTLSTTAINERYRYASSCYTQLGALSDDTGLVCYEKQGAGSGGATKPVPPECAFKGSAIFCMRFTVNP